MNFGLEGLRSGAQSIEKLHLTAVKSRPNAALHRRRTGTPYKISSLSGTHVQRELYWICI
jgi:hypothetical protein